jgi:hypothetical protein
MKGLLRSLNLIRFGLREEDSSARSLLRGVALVRG